MSATLKNSNSKNFTEKFLTKTKDFGVSPQRNDESTPKYVMGKFADSFMIGGGSLILLLLMNAMLAGNSPDSKIGWWVYNLSFLVNFPHFLVSYQILYYDNRASLFKYKRFLWAGVGAPILLASILFGGYLMNRVDVWGYLINAMYFFVGWHYVKQIFGGISVTNSLNKYYLNTLERFCLKGNLFSLWAISFIGFNIGDKNYIQDGIPYQSLNLSDWTLDAAYISLFCTLAGTIYLGFKKYIDDGKKPALAAIICWLTIYAWYLPTFSHPMYMHLIPFFHSMQYLFFVYTFKKNKTEKTILEQGIEPNSPASRKHWLKNMWAYMGLAIMTGATFMYFLPKNLDAQSITSQNSFGTTAFYFAFTVFINIHHYFIDNVIWRGDNEQMRKYLFSK